MLRLAILCIGLGLSAGLAGVVETQDTATAASKVCVLEVEGMSCSACAVTVEKAALKIAGVTAAKVGQPAGTAEITYDSRKVTPDAIAKAITRKTGFAAKARH